MQVNVNHYYLVIKMVNGGKVANGAVNLVKVANGGVNLVNGGRNG